jgi:glycosyltransferase involved in cell wall biosynthesis
MLALSDTKQRSIAQLSVIIPVYNQANNVLTSISRIEKVLRSCSLDYELIVVDDGSVDDTYKVLKSVLDPRIRVVSYTPNMGKGHAVKTGIINSIGKAVLFTDGDLDINPEVIRSYVTGLDDCDLVIASKRHPLSKVNATMSRKALSRAFNLLVRAVLGIKVGDTQSGLKAGNGDIMRSIFALMVIKRYAFDVELLTIASELKLRVKELPVELTLDRRFKMKDISKMFVDVMAIAYRARIKREYHKKINIMRGSILKQEIS